MTRAVAFIAALSVLASACTQADAGAPDGGSGSVHTAAPATARTPTTSASPAATSVPAPATSAAPPTTGPVRATGTTTLPLPGSETARPDDQVAIETVRGVPVEGGLPLDVFYPEPAGPWPAAMLVHGGGWISGTKEDLESLAVALARNGIVVFNAAYSPLDQGGVFPQMFEEVACALATAQETSPGYGGTPAVTLVGFSAGAHIAAVVALAGTELGGPCADRVDGIEGFAGISGPYDSDQFPFLALQFGGLRTEVPDAWAAGNPYTYLDANPDLEALLLHGGDDRIVDPSFSEVFGDALRDSGHHVTRDAFDGVGHFSIVDMTANGGPTAAAVTGYVWQRFSSGG